MGRGSSVDLIDQTAKSPVSTGGSDPRIRRTRSALQEAMASLVQEASPVTMSAVAQRAGLSRQVLHKHYDSIGQLATEVLVRRMLEGTGHESPSEPEPAAQALVDAVGREGLAPFLAFMQRDREVFLALRELAHGQTAAILARVFSGLFGGLRDIDESTTVDREAALFVVGGITALVDTWLRMQEPPDVARQVSLLERYARAVFAARR